jgi:hypothetical protein
MRASRRGDNGTLGQTKGFDRRLQRHRIIFSFDLVLGGHAGLGTVPTVTYALVIVGNFGVFVAANALAFGLFIPLLAPIGPLLWGRHWRELEHMGSALGVAYLLAGAVARAWTRRVWAVALPALLCVSALFVALSMAMYVGDGGDPNRAWQYAAPDKKTALLFFWVTVAAVTGWTLTELARRYTPLTTRSDSPPDKHA